jgi:hypothetical protein
MRSMLAILQNAGDAALYLSPQALKYEDLKRQ